MNTNAKSTPVTTLDYDWNVSADGRHVQLVRTTWIKVGRQIRGEITASTVLVELTASEFEAMTVDMVRTLPNVRFR